MDPVRQREIASEGGKAAHEKGTAHEFTSEEARQAGSKGGQAAHEKGTAHEFDSAEAREAGRKGGQASGGGSRGGSQGSGQEWRPRVVARAVATVSRRRKCEGRGWAPAFFRA